MHRPLNHIIEPSAYLADVWAVEIMCHVVQAAFVGSAAEGTMSAGDEIAVRLELRDMFGNKATAGPDSPLAVEASGVASIVFTSALDNVFWCHSPPFAWTFHSMLISRKFSAI